MYIAALALLFSITARSSDEDSFSSLSQFKWENRVILIQGPAQGIEELKQRDSEIRDRHIIWLHLNKRLIQTNSKKIPHDSLVKALNNEYFSKQIAVVLIGKDGGIKARQKTLCLNELFTLIDAMPMRIQEMNQ